MESGGRKVSNHVPYSNPEYTDKMTSLFSQLLSVRFIDYNDFWGDIPHCAQPRDIEVTTGMETIPSDLSTGPAVMSSPGQSKFTCANHTHGGSGIRDPDGSL